MQTVEEVKHALKADKPVTSVASLIRLGIEDGRKMLEDRPDVRPDYSDWYRARSIEGPCTACLAGAVMLGTLAKLGRHRLESCDLIDSHGLPIMYRRHQVAALCALDRVRQGNIDGAYKALRGFDWYDSAPRYHVQGLMQRRRRESKTNREGPTGAFFTSHFEFASHLDSLAVLARELERLERRWDA